MRKTNILYVVTKLELGGAQKQLLSLITNIDISSYNIFLFTANSGFLLEDALSLSRLRIKKSRFLERSISPVEDFLSLLEIYIFIRKEKIDIVHTHSSKAGILGRLAARLAGVKFIVHTVHGWSFNDYQSGLARKLFICLERLCARFSKRIIVVSEHDRKKGLSNGIGEPQKYRLINYGIDYSEFYTQDDSVKAKREELKIPQRDLVVGTICCFKAQKSIEDFVAFASSLSKFLPNVAFVLVGDGSLRSSIEKLIAGLGLREKIILTGWRRDIPEILRAMDVFVLTSKWEGMPISVLEAMVSSRPVVVTNTGGISEVVVDGDSGFLVGVCDVESMRNKVAALLLDSGMRKQIGLNAKERLGERFDIKNMVVNTQELYRDLLSSGMKAYAN